MKFQRILSTVLIVLLVLVGMSFTAAAEEPIEFGFSVDATGVLEVGDTFMVTVSLQNCPKIQSMTIIPTYDEEKLEILWCTWTQYVMGKGGIGEPYIILDPEDEDYDPDAFVPPSGAPVIAFSGKTNVNGDVMVIMFKVLKSSEGANLEIGADVIAKVTTSTTPIIGNPDGSAVNTTEMGQSATVVTQCTHAYGEWVVEGDTHWRNCTKCGFVADADTHTFDSSCDTDCNVCGTTREAPHNYATEWTFDADQHWYACTDGCGNKKDDDEHKFDNLCDADCNVCGATRVPNHVADGAWKNDADHHWQLCGTCGTEMLKADHVYSGTCGATCDTCGYERVVEHNYKTEWSMNAEKHWLECAGCQLKKDEGTHTYSSVCDENCDVCDYYRGEAPHNYKTEWTTDENGHWYACADCGQEKDKAKHTYDDTCDATCNVCNYERVAPHNYQAAWSTSETAHWYECAGCQLKKDEGTHTYSSVCDENCDVCDYYRGEAPHNYQTEWTTDENGHWYACADCGQEKDRAKHTYGGTCDATCNDCNYERVAPHDYKATWNKSETEHWHECAGCQLKKDVAEHIYDNNCDIACNVCGYERVAPHSYKTEWSNNTTSHWHACENCNRKNDEGNHEYTDACDASCNFCGYERKAPHNMTGASWTLTATAHKAICPTCSTIVEADHEFDHGCDTDCNAGCGYTRAASHYYDWKFDADSHWKECRVCLNVTVKQAHSLTNNKCSCGYAAHAHSLTKVPAKAATCTEAGTKEYYTCSGCDTWFEDAAGTKMMDKKNVAVAAKGHTEVADAAVDATCIEAGKTAGSHCSVCNAVIKAQETIPAKGHTEVADAAKDATCTEAGKTAGSHCSVCNAVVKAQETVSAKGHSFGEWKVDVDATETTDGKKTRTCSACNAVEEEVIPATGAVETDPVETDPVETEPVETQPVETDPVETDPAETDDDTNDDTNDKKNAGLTVILIGVAIAVVGGGVGVVIFLRKRNY